jgi:hypothetical protein
MQPEAAEQNNAAAAEGSSSSTTEVVVNYQEIQYAVDSFYSIVKPGTFVGAFDRDMLLACSLTYPLRMSSLQSF